MTPGLLHDLLLDQRHRGEDRVALVDRSECVTYAELADRAAAAARSLVEMGMTKGQRIATNLPKQHESVVAAFATSMAGCVHVPINPLLRPTQVAHILQDSGSHALVTTRARHSALRDELTRCASLHTVFETDIRPDDPAWSGSWPRLEGQPCNDTELPQLSDSDVAALLYTSGSTGQPKGVVLTHRNLTIGAQSVAQFLNVQADDVILSLLPLSFDAGFADITSALSQGATVVLENYRLPSQAVAACSEHHVTAITGVPALWAQLMSVDWPETATLNIRRWASTGGAMPTAILSQLRTTFQSAQPFLMYGLTEAFRSTYLAPSEIDSRSGSIGKAIPGADVMVVRPDGTPCDTDEPGELVHRGPLVAQGYWNDPAATAKRFRPAPGQSSDTPEPEIAVWSGDMVRRDEQGYLYFIGRTDSMIKTSGYRISPTEIEDIAYRSGLVDEAVALGRPHSDLGHEIVLAAVPLASSVKAADLLAFFREEAPRYMVPTEILLCSELPRNQNGKYDRARLLERIMMPGQNS